MGWGTHYNEPDNSCPLLDRILDETDTAVERVNLEYDKEDIIASLNDIDSHVEDIRTIASTLREQRRYFESEVERLEQELEESKDECSRLRGQLEEVSHV